MARVLVPLVGFIFLATASFGSVLGQAPSPTSMSVPGLAPSPMFVPSPESSFGPAPPPGPDCQTALLSLADCLSYVQQGSNLTKPDQPCCPELLNLVGSSPICLCKLLQDPKSSGFNIDINRALKLPSLCKAPSVSVCSALGIPVPAPVGSALGIPVPAPVGSALGIPVPAPVGSEGPSAPGGVPPTSVGSAPSNPGNGASRSVLSGGVLGAAILVSVFF